MISEIVITMSENDFDIMREMCAEAYHAAKEPRRGKYKACIQRLGRAAETLTLSWLDRKLAEFP